MLAGIVPAEVATPDLKTLLLSSIPQSVKNPQSKGFAFRRGSSGLEFLPAQATRTDNSGDGEYHGYPVKGVPGKVLRKLKYDGHTANAK